MHTGDAVPSVEPTATLPEIIHEISAKRLGITLVQADGVLIGVLSDGDLRRLFERDGPAAFHCTAAEIVNPAPRTIAHTPYAAEALALMEQHKITSLVVTADGTAGSAVIGVLHMHDILA
jgi:arabinose-5-phosphate isomerase